LFGSCPEAILTGHPKNGHHKLIRANRFCLVSEPSPQTTQLHRWLNRIDAGDLTARDELLRSVVGRLEGLARKMLRRFPGVRRWAETDDVLQNALMRLLRALQNIRPHSMREFFGLAAQQMRRELLDLARHYYGPHGEGANHASHAPANDSSAPAHEPPDRANEPDDLERWCAFHQEVENLPTEEREVVGLIFYHGWKQAEVAELFQISERTVRRRWESALVKLHGTLKDNA
jgi:RNA polymerase sigma-70 factor (ECF subfamily)